MHRPDAQLVTPSARIKPVDAYPNVTILQMQMPLSRWHNAQWVDEHRRGLLQEALAAANTTAKVSISHLPSPVWTVTEGVYEEAASNPPDGHASSHR